MEERRKMELAAHILRLGKSLAPDRFPQPNPETTAAWAEILGKQHFPLEVWPDAVRLWASEFVTDRMVTPKELIQAAKAVIKRWEVDPVQGERLRAHRQALQDERDAQIRAGTFGALRGYRPKEVEPPQPIPEEIRERLEEIKKAARP